MKACCVDALLNEAVYLVCSVARSVRSLVPKHQQELCGQPTQQSEPTALCWHQTMLVGICRLDVLAGRRNVCREAISVSRCVGNMTMIREWYEGRRAQRERASVHRALEVG